MVRPVIQWVHREFDAPDPWQAPGTTVRWRLLVCLLLGDRFADRPPAARTAGPESNAVPKNFVLVIATDSHQRYRILPLALQDLWRAGKVQDRDLPRLLHGMEGNLVRWDYPDAIVPFLLWIMRQMCAVMAVLFLGVCLWHMLHGGHVRKYAEWDQWLNQPMEKEQSLSIHGRIGPVELFSLAAPVAAPHGMTAEKPSTILAVVAAGQEKRLVLLPESTIARVPGEDGGPPHQYLLNMTSSVLLHTDRAHIGIAAAAVKQRFSDLNTAFVLCAGWDWPSTVDPSAEEPFQAALWLGSGFSVIGLFFWLTLLPFKWRRRRTAERFLAGLSGGPALVGGAR
jgi:hypothetical protein